MYLLFKLVHLTGIMLFFSGLSGMLFLFYENSTSSKSKAHTLALTSRMLGLTFILVGGLGMLYSLGLMNEGFPKWALAKLGVFFLFGPVVGMLRRKPKKAPTLFAIFILLGMTAAFLGLYKPF